MTEINIFFDAGFERAVDEAWLCKVATAVLDAENQPDAELGIMITGQKKIHDLNKHYRDADKPTDVLAFAFNDATSDIPFPALGDNLNHLGEVIISAEQAAIQAKQYRHSVTREIAVLLVHGVLHLLGYDHGEPNAEKAMNDRARAILKGLPRRTI